MNSYNQTRKIMEELGMKVNTVSSTQNRKVFVVVLEGTDSEFDELKRLGAVEVENMDILSKLPSLLTDIKRESDLGKNIKLESNSIYTNSVCKSQYISSSSVITERDVDKLPEETKEIVLRERGIITPLARDLAKKRGIKVVKG
ncbi:hypothetical protein [Alkaliphilus sp. B6464]|uniref:hypothetical protein n=1 Tax=Alkaliphilus sp. B6464 TaxID=2731219 RepID=UPI001BA4C43D|nr:hypothetical protein [Alkaliphilus sp. B6464]QUH19756.1 hypothetical protein HYG84_07465 [Alkaliphilus sp. B6464]